MKRELRTQFEQDLKKLLDYCEADEKTDFESMHELDQVGIESPEKINHIYLVIKRLREWLECPCCGIRCCNDMDIIEEGGKRYCSSCEADHPKSQ